MREARLDERLGLIQEAMQPQPDPQQQDHAWSRPQERPDPQEDIYANVSYNEGRLDRIERMIVESHDQQQHQHREQQELNYYQQSMSQHAARDPEFAAGYQNWWVSRAVELSSEYYPDATRDQLIQGYQRGQIDPRVVQQVSQRMYSEERQLYKTAIQRGIDPAAYVERMIIGRTGWENASTRAWRQQQIDQANARQRAAERKAEQAENDWFERVARRVAAASGYSHEDGLKEVLPRREDRQRYYEIRAKRQERSWPGSSSKFQRGAW